MKHELLVIVQKAFCLNQFFSLSTAHNQKNHFVFEF